MSTHVVPGFGTVLKRQVHLLWSSKAALFILLMLPGALLATAAAAAYWMPGSFSGPDFELIGMLPFVILMGGAWGILVWRDEPPSKRGYHRSLPVDVAAHHLARVAAGAVWLLPALLLYFAAGIFVTALRGDTGAVAAAGPTLWLGYLLAALILYGMMAALATAVERPLSWIVWGYVALAATAMLVAMAGTPDTFRWAVPLINRPYGLGWAVGGGLEIARARVTAQTPPAGAWFPVALGWLLVSTLLVFAAAHWRRVRT
jgi:hypothetical protein